MARKRARRLVLIVLSILVALLASGMLYQTLSVRRESARFPPPGRFVDVGGRRLHMICTGEGEPTIVFEASGLGSSLSFDRVRAEISGTRTCSYDRMGMGWSDPGPGVISAGLLADDLQRLLDRAGLRPPYILVPASVGGLTVELFSRRHPEQVAGLVFVDAGHSGILEHIAPRLSSPDVKTKVTLEAACLAKLAARLGLVRLLDPLGLRRLPSDGALTTALIYREEPMATLCAMLRGFQRSLQELREAPPLRPDVPLIVLSHENAGRLFPPGFESEAAAIEPEWNELQRRLARGSTRGTWRMVPGSDHLIAGSQPHAVAGAVLEMLAQTRADATPRE